MDNYTKDELVKFLEMLERIKKSIKAYRHFDNTIDTMETVIRTDLLPYWTIEKKVSNED